MRERLPERGGVDHSGELRMRVALGLAAALALCGCGDSGPGREPDGPLQTDDKPAAEQSPDPARAGELAAARPRFVGQWAADPASCKSDPWLFTATSLYTPAGSTCGFNRVTDVPGGYDIQATCSAEAPPRSDRLKIRFDEAAGMMQFESETIAGTALVFCGRTV
ncbi:MAG TPA: hypothetical protein VMK31_00145 [Sphingomicrobium sp.]|nr:hypothetical protein [Sphingomicrobium sp.]